MSEAQAGTMPAPEEEPPSLERDFTQAKARFEALAKAKGNLDVIDAELEKLIAMGDAVTQEDVVKAAGKLVAHGIEVKAVANLLAEMPTENGDLLADWLKANEKTLRDTQEMVMPQYLVAKHEMGVSALRMLAQESMKGGTTAGMPGELAPAVATTGAPPNPLMSPAGNA